jgi:hypothetical protein
MTYSQNVGDFECYRKSMWLGPLDGFKGEPILRLTELGIGTHTGKNAYWVAYKPGSDEWMGDLLEILQRLVEKTK